MHEGIPLHDRTQRPYRGCEMTQALVTRFERLSASLAHSDAAADLKPLQQAFGLAVERLPEAKAQHAIETAEALAALRMDLPTVATSIVASLEFLSPDEVRERFGSEIASLSEGVRRLQQTRWDRLGEESAESLRRMFLAMAAEVRVVIIELALRVQTMRTLPAVSDPEDRRRVARETVQIFAPLAHRLGIHQLKTELEDLSLRELEPEAYDQLSKLLNERLRERTQYVDEAMHVLRDKLQEQGIPATVSGRAKHLSSIFKKMQRKGAGLDQIHDISAVRVITDRVQDCYAVLGVIHGVWVPLPGRFKDYIARPKENLYQSLHTTVMGPGAKPLEIQIRTHEMHDYAEYGIAAHWAYKEGRRAVRSHDQKFMVLRQLMDWERDLADPRQIAESLKTDIFKDQVYVFTPAGNIIDLPVGATPLDFAYRVHTMIGHRCRGARVNDQIVPLDHQLRTGDRVEILTHKHPQPSRDWLNPSFGYLHTSQAKTKLRQWFRTQDRSQSVDQGRVIVEKEIVRLGLGHVSPGGDFGEARLR